MLQLLLKSQLTLVDAGDSPITNRLEIKLRTVLIAPTLGHHQHVRGPGHAQQEQDEEEWPQKLCIPVPQVHVPHTEPDQENANHEAEEGTNKQENC